MNSLLLKSIKAPRVKESYFSTCERDEQGRCLPSGETGKESQSKESKPQKQGILRDKNGRKIDEEELELAKTDKDIEKELREKLNEAGNAEFDKLLDKKPDDEKEQEVKEKPSQGLPEISKKPKNISVGGQLLPSKRKEAVRKLFGKNIDDATLGAIANAVNGVEVKVREDKGALKLEWADRGVQSEVTLKKVHGELTSYIDLFFIEEDSFYKGQGITIFSNQVEALRETGIPKIQCHAAGKAGSAIWNGYYTWPRIGFDGTIQEQTFSKLSDELQQQMRDSRSILDLMELSGGKEAWKQVGSDIYDAHFDLNENSRSMKIYKAYLEERSKKAHGKSYRETKGFDLSTPGEIKATGSVQRRAGSENSEGVTDVTEGNGSSGRVRRGFGVVSTLTQQRWIEILTKSNGPHKYGCVLAVLPDSVRKQITDWALENIPDFHVGPGCRESRPHVTLKYGFKNSDSETVQAIRSLLTKHGPIKIRLIGLSLFTTENEDGHVLKIDVESPQLHQLNKLLTESFDCYDKFPEFKPHITISYLSPEFSKQYESVTVPFVNQDLVLNKVEWTDSNKNRVEIPLSFLPVLGNKSWIVETYRRGVWEPIIDAETNAVAIFKSKAAAEAETRLYEGWDVRVVNQDDKRENKSMKAREESRQKSLSWLDNSRGGALVPPPKQELITIPPPKDRRTAVLQAMRNRQVLFGKELKALRLKYRKNLKPYRKYPNYLEQHLYTGGRLSQRRGETPESHFRKQGVSWEKQPERDRELFLLGMEDEKGVNSSLQSAGQWLANQWEKLEARYSRVGALSMAVAMLTTIPILGNIPAVIAVAEDIRGLHGYAQAAKKGGTSKEQEHASGDCEIGQRADLIGCTSAKLLRVKRLKSLQPPQVKTSWFEICPRDERGKCKPKGESDESDKEEKQSQSESSSKEKKEEVEATRKKVEEDIRKWKESRFNYEEGVSNRDSKVKLWRSPTHKEMMNLFVKSLAKQKHLSDGAKKSYKSAVERVIETMPVEAVKKMKTGLNQVMWYKNTEDLTKKWQKRGGIKLREGQIVFGFYSSKERSVSLDGITKKTNAPGFEGDLENVYGTYSHEFTHAIDYFRRYSSSQEWASAYEAEINGSIVTLSNYARTSSAEGFAEFGRLLYGSNANKEEAEKVFPKCFAFFRKRGLWE